MNPLQIGRTLLPFALACMVPAAFAWAQQTETEVRRGEVVYVSGNDLVVKTEAGQIKHFVVPEGATAVVDGKTLTVRDLKPGMKLTQTITTTETPKPAAAAAPTAAPRARRPRPQVMSVTPAAAERVKALIDSRGKPTVGIRIGVRSKGCSGMSYTLEFAEKQEPMDEIVETGGIKLLIDPKASLFLIGTEMDYEEEKLKSGFVFKNPNEKGRCGCGESFHV